MSEKNTEKDVTSISLLLDYADENGEKDHKCQETYHKEYYSFNYVLWTQEREDYFNGLLAAFEKIANEVNKFNDYASEETINHLIDSRQLQLNAG